MSVSFQFVPPHVGNEMSHKLGKKALYGKLKNLLNHKVVEKYKGESDKLAATN